MVYTKGLVMNKNSAEHTQAHLNTYIKHISLMVKDRFPGKRSSTVLYYLKHFRNASTLPLVQNKEFVEIVSFLLDHGMLAKQGTRQVCITHHGIELIEHLS